MIKRAGLLENSSIFGVFCLRSLACLTRYVAAQRRVARGSASFLNMGCGVQLLSGSIRTRTDT